MPSPKWKNVGIPREMWDLVKDIVDNHPEYGYTSVADFISSATRREIDYRLTLMRELNERQQDTA